MTVSMTQAIRVIRGIGGMTARRTGEGKEIRVNFTDSNGDNENTAYYTDSPEDAIATAKAMIASRVNKRLAGTVDCTPTWRSIVDIHAQAYGTGSMEAQKELHRMARLADALVTFQRHVEANLGSDSISCVIMRRDLRAMIAKANADQ